MVVMLENNATYLLGVVASYGSLFLKWVSNEHQILKRFLKLNRNTKANKTSKHGSSVRCSNSRHSRTWKQTIKLYFKQTQSTFKHLYKTYSTLFIVNTLYSEHWAVIIAKVQKGFLAFSILFLSKQSPGLIFLWNVCYRQKQFLYRGERIIRYSNIIRILEAEY